MMPRSVVALLAGIAVVLTGCQAQIQHGLDERQANELQAVLVERGFAVSKRAEAGKKPSWALEVDDEHAIDATRVLAEMGLPRPRSPTSLEVLGGVGLVPSPGEERARALIGLAGDLSQTLETVESVTSARVHLVLPSPARPGQSPGVSKASAFLKVRPGCAERVGQARDELKALLAASVEGLVPENVTLVISEVSTSVPAPRLAPSQAVRLRALAIVLGLAVCLLALSMVLMTVRLRRLRSKAEAGPMPIAPRRVTQPAARKAA